MHRRVLIGVVVALVVVLVAGAAAAAVAMNRQQHTAEGLRRSLADSQARVGTLNQAVSSDKTQISALQQQVDSAPSQANCSMVRYPPGLDDERILVICGPHAKDATDGLIEYQVSAAQATSYLSVHYPLDRVFFDASIPRIGTSN